MLGPRLTLQQASSFHQVGAWQPVESGGQWSRLPTVSDCAARKGKVHAAHMRQPWNIVLVTKRERVVMGQSSPTQARSIKTNKHKERDGKPKEDRTSPTQGHFSKTRSHNWPTRSIEKTQRMKLKMRRQKYKTNKEKDSKRRTGGKKQSIYLIKTLG